MNKEIRALKYGEKRGPDITWESAGPSKVQRNLRPKDLKMFEAKSTREHRNWVRDAEETFLLISQNFLTDNDKILWCNQFVGKGLALRMAIGGRIACKHVSNAYEKLGATHGHDSGVEAVLEQC